MPTHHFSRVLRVTRAVALGLTLAWSALFATTAVASPLAESGDDIVAAARQQVGVTLGYDGSYRRLDYPAGDVEPSTGVCSDVVIRALRVVGLDLQVGVHEDMRAAFDRYPALWGLRKPDRNIDHRRVPNLETWFARHAQSIKRSANPADYLAGDIVSWRLDSGLPHIGIVSDRRIDGRPLVIHNIGAGAQEEDVLFAWRQIGHYRLN